MTGITVGVLRGGPSSEYDVSLKTGGAVLRNLPAHYKPVDILIDKNGVWHRCGVPFSPQRIIRHIDVIFNALHGYYGEDGKVQNLLDSLLIPYTGSSSLASALGMNKALAKENFRRRGIKTPYAVILKRQSFGEDKALQLWRSMPQPSIIKPVSGGSSLGVVIAKNYNEFLNGFDHSFHFSDAVLVEEYIKGREATCGVIERFRGQELYALLPTEIIPPKGRFFDYESKYGGEAREMCPSHFSTTEKRRLMDCAIAAHKALGLRHYSRSDFIVSSRGVYLLEVNTSPGLTEESLWPKACSAIGCSLPDFLDHVIQLALNKY